MRPHNLVVFAGPLPAAAPMMASALLYNGTDSTSVPGREAMQMRYASTYDSTGAPVVAELQGDLLVPLAGLGELGAGTPAEVLAAAERRTADAFPASGAQLRPVVPNPAKVICVGLNYKSHIEETGRSDSDYPVLFPKFASSLAGPYDALDVSGAPEAVDYECELAVVIGKPARRVSEADALDHVLGYTVANDISMRDYQYKTHQWMQGKAWDACTPVGPYLVTPDEVDITAQTISPSSTGRRCRSPPSTCSSSRFPGSSPRSASSLSCAPAT